MMKKVSFLGLAMAAVLVSMTTSCQKDQDVVTLKATIEDYTGTDSKVYIDANDWAVWEDGDAVCVNDQLSLEITAGDNYTINDVTKSTTGYYAIYPANYVTDRQTTTVDGSSFEILMPANQTYKVNGAGAQIVKAPMVGYMDKHSSDGLLRFRNAANLLKLTVPQLSGYKVTFIEVEAETNTIPLSGDFTVATRSTYNDGNSLRLYATSGGTTSNSVALDCWNGGNGYDNGTFYIALPPFASTKLIISVYMQSTTDQKVYKYSKTSTSAVSLSRNTILPATFDFSGLTGTQVYEYPDHTSVGIFSVSSSKKVRFTKGNLYNTAGSNTFGTWHLEANQYDYRTYGGQAACFSGSYADNSTPTNNFGLFRFSTNGSNNKYGMYTENDTYTYYEGTFVDWSTNSVDNNESNYYCTLSADEWNHLLTGRNGNRYAIGDLYQLGGVHGIIILPDNCTAGVTRPNQPTPPQPNVNQNIAFTYIQTTARESLEKAGCVFLPATGYGDYTSNMSQLQVVYDHSNGSIMWGHYWSKTPEGTSTAYRCYFCNTHIFPNEANPRFHGRCVRLVVD